MRSLLYTVAAIFGTLAAGGCQGDKAVESAEEAVRRDLKDPDSGQFRDVARCGQGEIVRGEVNAKNSYGAYTGFKPFYSDGIAAATEVGDYDWHRLFKACMLAMGENTARISGKTFDRDTEEKRLDALSEPDNLDAETGDIEPLPTVTGNAERRPKPVSESVNEQPPMDYISVEQTLDEMHDHPNAFVVYDGEL